MGAQASLTQNIQTRSGNNLVVLFGGVPVGLIQSVRMADDYGLQPASGIGDIHVVEHVPGMARHSLSVQSMVLITGNLRAAGAIPENGDAVLQGLVFDFVKVDKATGAVLRKYIKCSYGSGDSDVTKHAIVMESAQYLACDVQGMG